jgi:hypothetical protein
MIRLFASIIVSCLLTMATTNNALAQEETVCIQCHAGQEGALAAPVEEWRQSIHAENGISCHDCHGGDPTDFAMAMSPDRGFIGAPDYVGVPDFCGRCHVGVRQYYGESAHGQAIEYGGAQCVICHNTHAILKAEISLINENDCSRCHDYGRASEIKDAIAETEQIIGSVELGIERLHRIGVSTDKMEESLFDLRNRYHRLFHSVDVEKIRSETEGFKDELVGVKQDIAGIDATLTQRKIWGGASVCLLFFGGIVSMLIRKTYHDEEGH